MSLLTDRTTRSISFAARRPTTTSSSPSGNRTTLGTLRPAPRGMT